MTRPPVLSDEQILARARGVFVERGYAARTKEVAAAVGLTWAAVANRFGNKQSLFMRAMAGAAFTPTGPACEPGGSAPLRDTLEQLRAYLWTWWPMRLQVRMAGPVANPDDEPEGLVHGLVEVLESHRRQGSVRSDLGPEPLARLVLALLIGDVAQRFVARDQALVADPVFMDRVVGLLSADTI